MGRWTIGALVMLGLCPFFAEPVNAQEQPLNAQVLQWLEMSCGVVDATTQPVSLDVLGSNAVPLFIEAFEMGPPQPSMVQVRAAALRRFERIQQMLNDDESFGLTDSNISLLRQTQLDLFVDQAVEDFTLAYGDAALRALHVIGGVNSREFLLLVSQNTASQHAVTATNLLREMVR